MSNPPVREPSFGFVVAPVWLEKAFRGREPGASLTLPFHVQQCPSFLKREVVRQYQRELLLGFGFNRWLIELAPHFYEFRGAGAGGAPRLGTKRPLGPDRPTPENLEESKVEGTERAK